MSIFKKWGKTFTTCLLALGTQVFADSGMRSTPAIDAPVALVGTGVSTTGFTANWNAVTGATGYKLTVDNDADFSSPITGFNEFDVGNVTTYAVVTPLQYDIPIYYRVKAYNSTDESAASDAQTVILTPFRLVENFEKATVGVIEKDGSTLINGVVFKGSEAKTKNSTKPPANPYKTQIVDGRNVNSAIGKCISLWCEDDTRQEVSGQNPVWGADGNPDKPVSNVIIELPKDTKLARVALDVVRVAGSALYWGKVQYSDDEQVTWKDIITSPRVGNPHWVVNQDVTLTGVDAIRINVWRNGGSDPREMVIDNIVLLENAPSYNLTYDFEGNDLEGWSIQGGSTFTKAVSVGNAYASTISGTYCLNTAFDGQTVKSANDALIGKVRSPIITLDAVSDGIVEVLVGGSKLGNNAGVAVFDAADDSLIARTMGENNVANMFKRVLTLNDYKGKDVYFELYDSITTSKGHAIIDNLRIKGAVSDSSGPGNFQAVTKSISEIDLSWDAVTGADSYKVYAALDSAFNTPVTGYPKTVSAVTEQLQGLQPGITYYFGVSSVKGGVESYRTVTAETTFYNAGTTDGVDYVLENIYVGKTLNRWQTYNVKTIKAPLNFENVNASGASDWYVNQSNTYTAQVNAGNTIQIKVDTNDNWSAGKVWVDWNHDGSFEDASTADFKNNNKKELVGYFTHKQKNKSKAWKSVLPTSPDSETITFTVPAEVDLPKLPLKTRIRIVVTDGGAHGPDAVLPDNFSYTDAQIQDYGIYFSKDVLPPGTPELSYSNLSSTGFDLSWDNNPYADGYYLTVDDDADFLSPLSGYDRKKITGANSERVNTVIKAGFPHYCKITAYNSNNAGKEQESDESDTLFVYQEPASTAGKMIYYPGKAGHQVASTDFDPDNLSAFTYTSWFKSDGLPGLGALCSIRDKNTVRLSVYLTEFDNRGRTGVGFGTDDDPDKLDVLFYNGKAVKTFANVVPKGKAVHLGFSSSVANGIRLFLNSKELAHEPAFLEGNAKPGVVSFGYVSNVGEALVGAAVDEVAVWAKELSSEEIRLQMHTALTGSESDLMLAMNYEADPVVDLTGTYTMAKFGTPQFVDSTALQVTTVNSVSLADEQLLWDGELEGSDVAGMNINNITGITFNNTYLAYGPYVKDNGQEEGAGALPAPSLTTRGLIANTDAVVRLTRLFGVEEVAVEATGDVVFDKRQLSVIFGTSDTYRLIKRNYADDRPAGVDDFVLVKSTIDGNNATGSRGEYAVGVENNGYITFSGIAFENGFYTLASIGSGLTPAFMVDVTLQDGVLAWRVGEEISVKHYLVRYELNGIVEEQVILAEDKVNYMVKVPEGAVEVKLIIVDHSGHYDERLPADGKTEVSNYTLYKGWNLISLPSDNNDLSDLHRKANGPIWGWNGSSYEVVDSSEATDAMWVYLDKDATATVIGDKSDAVMVLEMGWNMVGPTKDCYIPAGVDAAFTWHSVYTQLAEDGQLFHKVGYWIFYTGSESAE